MEKFDDGGSAFPYKSSYGDVFEGMTLHDYFAGQALMGILSSVNVFSSDSVEERENNFRAVINNSFLVADLMISEKRRRENGKE